jgi:hypothetical protein
MIAGNLFSLLFGWNFDRNDDKVLKHPAHNSTTPATAVAAAASAIIGARAGLPSTEIRCSKGPECYVDSIYVTIAATFFTVGLSVWAGMRDRRKIKKALRRRREALVNEERD